jgi:hypothetical protein
MDILVGFIVLVFIILRHKQRMVTAILKKNILGEGEI